MQVFCIERHNSIILDKRFQFEKPPPASFMKNVPIAKLIPATPYRRPYPLHRWNALVHSWLDLSSNLNTHCFTHSLSIPHHFATALNLTISGCLVQSVQTF